MLAFESGLGLILVALALRSPRDDALGDAALMIGVSAGVALAIGALPVQGRPLAGWLLSRQQLRRAARRRAAEGNHRASARPTPAPFIATPLATTPLDGLPHALFGPVSVASLPAQRQIHLATLRRESAWTIALAVQGDPPAGRAGPAALADLASLLAIDIAPLTWARLHTAVNGATRTIDRHVLLSLNAADAADAIARHGGSAAALGRLLRRIGIRAMDLLHAQGIAATPVDEAGLVTLARSGIDAGAAARAFEEWDAVTAGMSRTATLGLGGSADVALGFTQALMTPWGGPLQSSMLIATRRRGRDEFALLVRTRDAHPATLHSIRTTAGRAGLRLDPLVGRQRAGLLAASPAGGPGSHVWAGVSETLPARFLRVPPQLTRVAPTAQPAGLSGRPAA